MKILVINTGSSSIKYQLFDMDRHEVLASGLAEKIGEESGRLVHKKHDQGDEPKETTLPDTIADHRQGLEMIGDLLVDGEHGAIGDISEITAVGHRVVHGGEDFQAPTVIDEKVLAAIKANAPLAPLHNPPNLVGIAEAREIFPQAPQVAVFDTAFHQTIPPRAFLYALPYELYEEHRVRRYGFHGTSHAYVAEKAAEFLGRPLAELKMITIHLGNGASMAALSEGRCQDTSMGLTPLEGLVMGTRCGDVDPALPFFLADHLGLSLKEIDGLLNKKSGLKGLTGRNDMREVLEKRAAGEPRADLAVQVYAYRIKKYIGAYTAALGGLDALVFTAGIGENSPEIRALSCEGLECLGVEISPEANESRERGLRLISSPEGRVKVLVAPTNEELRIALETEKVIRSRA